MRSIPVRHVSLFWHSLMMHDNNARKLLLNVIKHITKWALPCSSKFKSPPNVKNFNFVSSILSCILVKSYLETLIPVSIFATLWILFAANIKIYQIQLKIVTNKEITTFSKEQDCHCKQNTISEEESENVLIKWHNVRVRAHFFPTQHKMWASRTSSSSTNHTTGWSGYASSHYITQKSMIACWRSMV